MNFGLGFNHEGKFTTFPSAFVSINTDDLRLRSDAPTGTLALLATGAGFIPPKVATPLAVNVGAPSRILASSDLLKTANLAWPAFGDLDRGPGLILLVPVTPATKATKVLSSSLPAALLTLSSKGWGLSFNSIMVSVATEDVTISLVTAAAGTITETYDGDEYTTIAELVALINARSGLVEATFTAEGTLADLASSAFTGGTEPAATAADWADAHNALNPYRVNAIHPATADTAIWAQTKAYASLKRCRGFIGSALKNWNGISNRQASAATLVSEAALMNDRRMMHVGLGMNGLAGYLAAARYAALAAAVEPSVPMTFKHLDVDSLEALLDIDTEVGGITGLLINGVAAPVPDPDAPNTFLCSRGLSTKAPTAVTYYDAEHSVLAAVDAVSDLVLQGVGRFRGQEGRPVKARQAMEVMDSILAEASTEHAAIRIESYDRKSIKATFADTILRLEADVTPILPINFIDVRLRLKRSSFSLSIDVPL